MKPKGSPYLFARLSLLTLGVFFLSHTAFVSAQSSDEIKSAIEDTVSQVQDTIEEASELNPDTQETIDEIKKRIEKTVEENDQVKGVMEDVSLKRKAVVGQVERVTEDAITIVNKNGRLILPINQDVKYIKSKKSIQLSEIAVGNWVTVLGMVTADSNLDPKFIVVSTETLDTNPQFVLLGSIEEINKTSVAVVSRFDQTTRTFTINKNTKFQDSTGEEAEVAEFSEDMNILIVGIETTKTNGEKETVALSIRSLAPLSEDESADER